MGRTIGAIPILMSPSTLDCISWAYSPLGNFDGKSAYRIAKRERGEAGFFEGKWIWKVDTLPKIQCFIWKCYLHSLPVNMGRTIGAIPILMSPSTLDCISWAYSPLGNFDGKSAYRIAKRERGEAGFFEGKWIWKVDTLPKIQCFIWKCYLHSLPVKELLVARGIAENGVCEYCRLGSGSILHVLRDRTFAKNFWTNLNNTLCDEDFFNSRLCGWLKRNLKDSKDLAVGQTSWEVQFSFGIWSLWTHRDKRFFKHDEPNFRLARETHNLATNFFYCAGRTRQRATKVLASVRWNKPKMNWYMLNTDGSSVGNPGKAGGGELWALRDGLQICYAMGMQAVEIEIDVKTVADWVVGSTSINTAHSVLISNCRYLMEQLPKVKLKHCFREANQCVDFLAKKRAVQ
nr:putative ribonuclease h protein [Quercus suber]